MSKSQSQQQAQQPHTTTKQPYQRRQGRIAKAWNGSFDIVDSVFNTTHSVVTHTGSAISNTAKLVDTGITGISEIGIITMNSLADEMVTNSVIDAIHLQGEVSQALTEAGLDEDAFTTAKARLLRGTNI